MDPAMLFKHLLKLTVLQCQQLENNPSGTATAPYSQWNLKANEKRGKGKKDGVGERKAMEGGITSSSSLVHEGSD